MFESVMIAMVVVGLNVALWRLYVRALRDLDRAEQDAGGPVVLTRRERAAIRDLERQLGWTATQDPLVH